MLNCEMDAKKIIEGGYDAAVIATGSHPTLPEVPGLGSGITMIDPREAMKHPEKIGKNVAVIDRIGYWQAMGVADYIAALGSHVSLVTAKLYAGVDIEETCRENLNRRLARKGAETFTSCKLKRVENRDVILESIFAPGREYVIKDVDTIVAASESRSDNLVYRELRETSDMEAYVLGDAAAPGTVLRIIFDAEELGRRV